MKGTPITQKIGLVVLMFSLLFINGIKLNAQTISRQVIGAIGGSTEFSNIKVNWTAGEAFIGQGTSDNQQNVVTIGFQQPDFSLLPPPNGEELLISISPNPTADFLNITLLDPQMKEVRLTLSNTQGQILAPNLLLGPWKNEIDISRYAAGVYYLTLSHPDNSSQTYRIIKTK